MACRLFRIRSARWTSRIRGRSTTRHFRCCCLAIGSPTALFTLGHSFASLDLVDWRTSGTVVVMTILGGIGTLWGSVIGAAIFLLLRDSLSTITDAWGVITGTVFVVIVLAFRRGVWGTILQLRLPAARSRGVAVAAAKDTPAVQPTRASESLIS